MLFLFRILKLKLRGAFRMGDDNNIFDDKPLSDLGSDRPGGDRNLTANGRSNLNPTDGSRSSSGTAESRFASSQLSYQSADTTEPSVSRQAPDSPSLARQVPANIDGFAASRYQNGGQPAPARLGVQESQPISDINRVPISSSNSDYLEPNYESSQNMGGSIDSQFNRQPVYNKNSKQQPNNLNQYSGRPNRSEGNYQSEDIATDGKNPTGPREEYGYNDIAPNHQQTYEESVAFANNASQIIDSAKTKKHHSVYIKMFLILLALLLIAGIIVGAYFYIKTTTSPKYIVGQTFSKVKEQKLDVSFLYQMKNGDVYDDKITIDEQYDGGGNKSNLIVVNLDDSKTVKLDLRHYQSQNYFLVNGLQNSSSYFQNYSQALAKTINSSGVVLDNQWVELNSDQDIRMPTDIMRSVYLLADAVDLDSIKLESKKGQIATYSLKFNKDKFNNVATKIVDSDDFTDFNNFNIKSKIGDLLAANDVNKLKFSIQVNQKNKFLEKIAVTDESQTQIITFSLKAHQNKSIEAPTQAKSYSEITRELQAATSQQGVDLSKILSE
ncbi:MAG TPA: hypothetical protein PKA29_01530 [Candidatus Saccharibacteria bacterium]|nr:hypothetical protein [Candidatus Saccharibacteria bacterium]